MTDPFDVVLPCRDEAAALPAVLASLPPGWRAVVVDNGSSDATGDVARSLGALVVHEPVPGYGSAVHAGLMAATAPWVATMDADGSVHGSVLPALAAPVLDGSVDVALGRRVPTSGARWPWHARAGTAYFAARLRRRGLPVHDVAAVRFASRETMLRLDVRDRRSGYPVELLVRAVQQGLLVCEVDVPYGPRAAGTTSKVSGSVRGTLTAARDFSAALR